MEGLMGCRDQRGDAGTRYREMEGGSDQMWGWRDAGMRYETQRDRGTQRAVVGLEGCRTRCREREGCRNQICNEGMWGPKTERWRDPYGEIERCRVQIWKDGVMQEPAVGVEG